MMTDPAGTNEARPTATHLGGSATPRGDLAEPEARKKAGDSKPRPKTILEFIEYSYDAGGRKLGLARKSLRELTVDPESAEAEMRALRRHAGYDLLLAVPPTILLALAEVALAPPVRRRILDLVVAAFACHPVFAAQLERLVDPAVEPELTAQEVSDSAKLTTTVSLGVEEPAELKDGEREKLRVNAVTAFLLFRVLRDHWTLDRFVADMAAVVWATPGLPRDAGAAAVLAASRSPEAMSQLSRHFERLLADAGKQAEEEHASAVRESRRADRLDEERRGLTMELESEKLKVQNLVDQVADLTRRLETEQSSRVVDNSHYAYDYEALRTQVIRRLSGQAELLNDGLHALRNERYGVAEEFLDRSLTAIEGEVARLKDLDGDRQ